MSLAREQIPEWEAYASSQGLELVGRGRWRTTRCDLHGGTDSLRCNTETGGWVCMACGAKGGDTLGHYMQITGTEFVEAAKDLGCWQDDGRPAPPPRSITAATAMEVLDGESHLAWVAACNVAQGVELTREDRDRLSLAAQRIATVRGAFYGSR